jgi:hypothetical protein
LIDEIIDLRNKVHKGNFRFALTPEHWKALYVPEKMEKSNLATVRNHERLTGYAAFYLVNFDQVRAYDVREIIAEDENTLTQLLSQITDKGMKDNVDFIFLKRCEEAYSNVFERKGFSPFVESVIMIALFDPKKLLSTLSEKVENGKVLRLLIEGFDPIDIKIGEKGIMLVNEEKPDLVVSTDHKTFIGLFFARTSFLKEFLRRKIRVNSAFGLPTANRFFNIAKQAKWYVPMGDWV